MIRAFGAGRLQRGCEDIFSAKSAASPDSAGVNSY